MSLQADTQLGRLPQQQLTAHPEALLERIHVKAGSGRKALAVLPELVQAGLEPAPAGLPAAAQQRRATQGREQRGEDGQTQHAVAVPLKAAP